MAYEENALTICTDLLTAVTGVVKCDSDTEPNKDKDGQTCILYGKRVVKSVVALLLNLLRADEDVLETWREQGGVDLILQVLSKYRNDQVIAVILGCMCMCMWVGGCCCVHKSFMYACMYTCRYVCMEVLNKYRNDQVI
jgi:hypothetical protein